MPYLTPYDTGGPLQDLISFRRDLHQHPELGFAETRTSRVIRERLGASGLVVRALAGTGLIATLQGDKPGPTILVRAELDALPIQEISSVAYRSTSPGVMHACGHDAHCAIATLVARRLAEERESLRGTIKFAFQPSEEIAEGAERMIADGALENPRVDAAVALHVWQPMPVGIVGVSGGPIWAAVDELSFVVRGALGHGAMPNQGIDAIVAAAQIVTALQTVITRTRPPLDPAVLSIGSIQGGTAWNIIADRVEMHGTLRTFDPHVRDLLLGQIHRVARGVAESLGASCEVEDRYSAPAVVNDPELAALVRNSVIPIMGEDNVVPSQLSLVGDDFAHFIQQIPGCLFHVGSSNAAKGLDHGHHDSTFDIDESCLPIGAASLEAVIRGLLAQS
ncbi:MAG: amidohydrolase [Chloroflexi bacterium]|nr:amidohydrolase [Chloroflexota bacterium]